MPMNIDQYVGVHAAALDVRARRGELIANNLANADTPGYQARDIDFRQAMARASGEATTGVTLSTTQAGHIGGAFDIGMRVMLRKHGLDDKRDVTIIESDYINMNAMLLAKKVDLTIGLDLQAFEGDPTHRALRYVPHRHAGVERR